MLDAEAPVSPGMEISPASSGTAISISSVSDSSPKAYPPHPSLLFQPSKFNAAPPNPTAFLSPIASGACSEVFKCVIKKPEIIQMEINGELQSNSPDVTAQFLAELLVYTTVTRHRNITAFLGCLDGVGLVLEYIDGRSLLDVARQRPQMERRIAIDYHNQLLDGLSHLHSFGMSHGDLSLSNVLVEEPSGTIKLFDFGRSTTTRDPLVSPVSQSVEAALGSDHPALQNTIHPGTRPFTAPEVLRGECTDARVADAYSFGMILLCMDRGGVVNIDQRQQRKDLMPNLLGLNIFVDMVEPYLRKASSRQRISKEARIRLADDLLWRD